MKLYTDINIPPYIFDKFANNPTPSPTVNSTPCSTPHEHTQTLHTEDHNIKLFYKLAVI